MQIHLHHVTKKPQHEVAIRARGYLEVHIRTLRRLGLSGIDDHKGSTIVATQRPNELARTGTTLTDNRVGPHQNDI